MAVNWSIPKYHAYLTCQIVIQNIKYTLCNNFKQGVRPGVLQIFSTCAVKPYYTNVHLVPPGVL